jgi:hypothetical protein
MARPLPIETVSHILDLATSPSHIASAFQDDCELLRQCCLVSKRFRDVAQPKLWKSFRPREGELAAIASLRPDLAKHIRSLIVRMEKQDESFNSGLKGADKLPKLTEIRISNDGALAGAFLTKRGMASLTGTYPLLPSIRLVP